MLNKLLFQLSTLTRSSANEETGLRQEVCPPSLAGDRPSRGSRWLDSLSSWLRGASAQAPERSAAGAALADLYLESTKLPDADTRLCPRVVESRIERTSPFGASRAWKAAQQLEQARRELADALGDIPAERGHDLRSRIRQAQTLRELWHLRADVFTLVSIEHDQLEADRRLALVNRHFPMRSPRSGALMHVQAPARPAPDVRRL